METGDHEFFIGDNESEIKVSSELQYFVSETNYCQEKQLKNKKKIQLSVRDAVENCDSIHIDENVSYILDIDLDFFSTANPFLSIYDKADCYGQLKSIFAYESQGLPVDEIVNRRRKQVEDLSQAFEYLKEHNNLEEFEYSGNMYELYLLKKLVLELKSKYSEEEIDWEIVYNSGLTCDNGGLPHHLSSNQELENYFKNFENIISQINKEPTIITISRSSEDNYCPGVVVDEIQEKVLEILENVFKEKLNNNPVLFYEGDDCIDIFKSH